MAACTRKLSLLRRDVGKRWKAPLRRHTWLDRSVVEEVVLMEELEYQAKLDSRT